MNGFVYSWRPVAWVAAATFATITTTASNTWAQGTCAIGRCPASAGGSPCQVAVATPACDLGNCPSCPKASPKCGHSLLSKCQQQYEDFDKEQLHPDHCWPDQYVRESKRRVYDPFGQQMINGNRLELTIWPHYFSIEEGKQAELTVAGQERLRYLARKRPYVIPSLELQTSFDRELDQKRTVAIVNCVTRYSMEPVNWQVAMVNRESQGLFGQEAPKAIGKMIGPAGGPPVYERNIKQSFFSSGSGQ